MLQYYLSRRYFPLDLMNLVILLIPCSQWDLKHLVLRLIQLNQSDHLHQSLPLFPLDLMLRSLLLSQYFRWGRMLQCRQWLRYFPLDLNYLYFP